MHQDKGFTRREWSVLSVVTVVIVVMFSIGLYLTRPNDSTIAAQHPEGALMVFAVDLFSDEGVGDARLILVGDGPFISPTTGVIFDINTDVFGWINTTSVNVGSYHWSCVKDGYPVVTGTTEIFENMTTSLVISFIPFNVPEGGY